MAHGPHKRANVVWTIPIEGTLSHEQARLTVLMDIRAELKELNNALNCYRIQQMFKTIERMDRRSARKKRR